MGDGEGELVGSAVENAAKQVGHELDFQQLFSAQEEDDEESASLADNGRPARS